MNLMLDFQLEANFIEINLEWDHRPSYLLVTWRFIIFSVKLIVSVPSGYFMRTTSDPV